MLGKFEVLIYLFDPSVLLSSMPNWIHYFPQTLVTPGRRFIFEGPIQQLDDKKTTPTSSPGKLDAPRAHKHRRNRSMGSLAISSIISRDKEKDNSFSSLNVGGSAALKKKYSDRYCFIFDDVVVLAKRTNIGTLLSEPGSALMFFTKKTKSKFRNERKELNWASLAAGGGSPGAPGGDDEPPAESFQFHW